MLGIRKILINESEINNAKFYNQQIAHEYPDEYSRPQFMPIPKPIFNEVNYRFRINLVNSFYIEDENNSTKRNDIVANILYEGVVRLKYNPIIVNKLDLSINGE